MLDKSAARQSTCALFRNSFTLTLMICSLLFTTSAYALVGGGGNDVVPCFTQNLGGGSSSGALPPPGSATFVVPFSTGTLITFDPSCTYLPVSPNPNQVFLYTTQWDFGDPSPDLSAAVGPLDPTNPTSLATLLGTVSHAYVNQGVYGVINANTPGGPPGSLELGPKLIVQQFIQTNFTVTATAINGSAVLTGVNSTTGLAIGGTVSGFGIPANTVVASFTANTITMNQKAVVSIPVLATAALGSNVLTLAPTSSTSGIAVGGPVTGPGIPANTTVAAFTPTTITLSNNATATSPAAGNTFLIGGTTGTYTISVIQPGTQATAQSTVTIQDANRAPVAVLTNIGSAPTVNGVPLTVTASASNDPDGYIIYAAIDWGDGVTQLVKQPSGPSLPLAANVAAPAFIPLLPNPIMTPNTTGFDLQGIPIQHVYSAPGTYNVTLTVIDNGRLIPNNTVVINPTPPPTNVPQPLPFPLLAVPDPSDPNAALAAIVKFHQDKTTYGTEALPNHRFDPQIAQAFLTVTVPGNLNTASSQFAVDFKKTNNDSLALTLNLTAASPLDTLSASTVSFTVGTANGLGAPAQFNFTTDARGRFNSSNVKFSFDPRKQIIKITVSKSALHDNVAGGALNLKDQTVPNGSVDAKFTLVVNGGAPIVVFVRYQYKAKAGGKGNGRNGHAILGGNSIR
jgi:hypothetical protein